MGKALIIGIGLLLLFCNVPNYEYRVEKDTCFVQVYGQHQNVDEFYAELTWEDGRRTSVNLGYNKEGEYRIPLYGPLKSLKIYSNLEGP